MTIIAFSSRCEFIASTSLAIGEVKILCWLFSLLLRLQLVVTDYRHSLLTGQTACFHSNNVQDHTCRWHYWTLALSLTECGVGTSKTWLQEVYGAKVDGRLGDRQTLTHFWLIFSVFPVRLFRVFKNFIKIWWIIADFVCCQTSVCSCLKRWVGAEINCKMVDGYQVDILFSHINNDYCSVESWSKTPRLLIRSGIRGGRYAFNFRVNSFDILEKKSSSVWRW